MAKINYNDIQSIDQSWENYAGSSVEKFIKKQLNSKAGYLYRSSSKEGDYYYLYGFTSYEQYEDWAGGDSTIVPLFKVQLPNMENDTFSVNLTTNSNTTKLVNLGEGVIINLRYTSVSTNPTTGVSVDTYNEGTLIIQRSANGSAFTEVGRVTIQPTPNADPSFREFNLTPYLVDGDNKFRLRVEDNVNGSVSATLVFNSVINTTLAIQNATSTANPLRALQFQYYIQGQVDKTLHIKISQGGTNQTFAFPLGQNTYIEVPYTTPVINMSVETGIVEVEAWLSVDDTTVVSYSEVNQFYYTDGSVTSTVIILNEVNTNIINYTNQHLFDMTLYNNGDDVMVYVKSQDGNTNYLTLTYNNCQTGVVYPVYATLELDSNADSIPAMVVVTSSSFNCTPYSITIDNTEKMSPVTGASFVLNPKIRNNSEEHPNTIINSVTGSTVSSTFTGFGFINDGWVSDDDNIGVLRIPSDHTLTINYDPLNNLTHGTSIEIDYKVYSIFNDNDEIIKMYTTNDNDDVLGFVMNGTEAAFYTAENQTKRDQDVIFQEEVRTHMVINIVPNLANSGLNYIRIFVNGILNREMLYSGTDVFKTGTVSMVFGSQNCDLDIYGIRVYKSGLSASDIRQNYMSSLPSIEEKTAFKEANNILSANGTISYDRARVKYNTLIWTGQVPSYSTGNREYEGKLQINILGDAAHSGTITNLKIKGQGSSSRGYWKWNHQYDWNKLSEDSVWTDSNGTIHTDGYTLTDEDPAAVKLVAKLNWASSMQSHKLGSTSMYTDLWRTIVGGNSITKTTGYEKARVSVHEKPFLYFVKESENAQPVFYGLMTFGSAKYDKPTFGYDKNVFPDYLILEGSDNGMPLTNRQVPWFTDEVTYNAEEEYYEYAGQGNLDYGMGKQENITYFQDAFNFTYLHSPFLAPFTGSISADADKKYQYWNTSTKNVYRYDYISQDWVNAGITKSNEQYDVLNLETQTGLSRSSYSSDTEYTNAVIAWRNTDFKSRVGVYYNTTDVLYSIALLKLIGASDNRCKNTYEYLDPVTHKLCLAQDDMDTLMLTDNVGRKTKPYYVEEYDLDPEGKPYFNGSDNVFYCLMDSTFDAEEKAMMKQILTEMVNQYDSVSGCIQHYFFNVQEYFPAVAYNETARLLYEEASVKQSQGIYVNGTPAISQSLGDQLQAERQWWKRRIPYMQSWSSTDPFYTRSTTEPNLQFRSMTTTISTNPDYSFALTPWQYLYPKVGTGQYLSYDNTRVPARTVYNTATMSTDGNTDTFIYGSNYYTSYGEFGGISLSETFNLVGDRLLEFSADSREVIRYDFRPIRMTVTCPELRYLCLYGCSTLSGSLDLSGSSKLGTVDLRNTAITSLVLPETEKLEYAYLPDLTSLYMVRVPNVNYSISSYNNLVNLTTDNSVLALDVMENADYIGILNLIDIDITTTSSNVDAVLGVLADPDVTCNITGTIYLAKALNSTEKNALEAKFGPDVFLNTSDFYITFIESPIISVTLTASKNTLGNNDELYIDATWSGNDDAAYSWSVNATNDLILTKTKTRLTIQTESLSSVEQATVTYTLTKTNGTQITQTTTINLINYTFYINGVPFNNYVQTMLYGSGDSSVTYTDGWTVTCDDQEATFSISGVSVTGGTAVYSGTTISSITKTTLSNNQEYNCTVTLTVESLSFAFTFKIKTVLVGMTINDIADIQTTTGDGSVNVGFSYPSVYSGNLSVVSATVSSGGGTNSVSNLTINGCTITISGYSADAVKTLTLTYKVNNGSNCTTTKNFNVRYVEIGATIKATYDGTTLQTSNGWYVLNPVFTIPGTGSIWPMSNNSYVEQESCSVVYGGNTYNLTWDNDYYKYVQNDQVVIMLNPADGVSLHILSTLYSQDSDVTINLTLSDSSNFNNFNILWNNNTSVKSIEIQDAKYIGSNSSSNFASTFKGCTSLASLTLGSATTTLATNIFYNCSSLKRITCLATTAPTISRNTFTYIAGNGTLSYPIGSDYSVWLGKSNAYLGYYDWNNLVITYNGLRYRIIDRGTNHTYDASVLSPISGTSYSGNITIPSSFSYGTLSCVVTSISNSAFNNQTGLLSVVIPNSVTTIGTKAFRYCSNLNSVTLGNGITEIPSGCFQNSGITSITIPEGVTSIADSAFRNCINLTTIVLPSTISTIDQSPTPGTGAFSYCTKVSSITINKSTAPTIADYAWGGDITGNNNNVTGSESGTTNVLYVPQGATGYDDTKWTTYLLNSSYGNFTVSYTL